jgi:hypothetical protein
MNETTRQPLGRPADPRRPGMSHDDADALLAINAHVRTPSPEWVEFLGETLSTWLVEHRAPAGVVDDGKAQWLIARIDEGGMVTSPGALALLRRCCVKARTVPASLLAYLRDQENRIRGGQDIRPREGQPAVACINGDRRMTGA